MDEQPERDTGQSREAERRRRLIVLAELRRRRSRRRWIVGLSTVAATGLIASGSVVAWSSQARASDLATQIEAWHVEHDHAQCELAVRVVRAVALERRAKDVLDAAEHIAGAEWLLPPGERAAFAADRERLLGAIVDNGFVTDEDRELAAAWEERAAKADPSMPFDLLATCLADAEANREPIVGVTAERADALARELRELGDPRDFDDSRIDRFEAALEQLRSTATATARARLPLDTLAAEFTLAPDDALQALHESDQRLNETLDLLEGEHRPSDVLDLVEGIALHLAAAWMAEAWQLDAQGQADAAAARAAAAQQTRDSIAQAAPRPVTDPGPVRPAPPAGPRTPQAPTVPAPVTPVDPGTTSPSPSDPGTSTAPTNPTPVEPNPSSPAPGSPQPTTTPTEPTTPTDPSTPTNPSTPPAPAPDQPPVEPQPSEEAGRIGIPGTEFGSLLPTPPVPPESTSSQ